MAGAQDKVQHVGAGHSPDLRRAGDICLFCHGAADHAHIQWLPGEQLGHIILCVVHPSDVASHCGVDDPGIR